MLKFLKKFLAQKEEEAKPVEPLSLKLEEAPQILKDQRQGREGKATQAITDAMRTVQERKRAVEDALKNLQEAKLRNENIPPKAMQYMKGNRESYIRMTEMLLRDGLPSPDISESQRALHAISAFKEQLGQYHDSTLRNYQVLQQFFAHESHAVAKQVKQLDESLKKLENRLDELGLRRLSELQDQAEHLLKLRERQQELRSESEEARQELERKKEAKRKANETLGEFLKTKDFFSFEQKKKDLKSLHGELQEHQSNVRLAFSSLEKPLKKLSKVTIENEELITEYVYRPEEAVAKDTQLQISTILARLRDSINSGSVSLDGKKKEKALEGIDSLDRESLERYRTRAQELAAKREKVEAEIANDAARGRHQELLEILSKRTEAVHLAERAVGQAEEALRSMTLDQDLKELSMNMENVLGRPVIFTDGAGRVSGGEGQMPTETEKAAGPANSSEQKG